MTGHKDYNWPFFNKIAKYLRSGPRVYDLCNPVECGDQSKSYIWNLKQDLIGLLGCEGIILLPGWSESRGATFEMLIAKVLDYKFLLLVEIQGTEHYGLVDFNYELQQILAHFISNHLPEYILQLIPPRYKFAPDTLRAIDAASAEG